MKRGRLTKVTCFLSITWKKEEEEKKKMVTREVKKDAKSVLPMYLQQARVLNTNPKRGNRSLQNPSSCPNEQKACQQALLPPTL